MQLFRPDWSPNVASLIRLLTVLAWLLIALAVIALAGDLLDLLGRFRSEVYLFVIGAILAYLMAPVVEALKRVVRVQWAAVLTAYILLFAGLVIFAILLINPFISQAGSLVNNLHNPNSKNLAGIQIVQRDISRVQTDLAAQQTLLGNQQAISAQRVQQTQLDITTLAQQVSGLAPATLPRGAIQIPPSYITPIAAPVTQLRIDYGQVASTPNSINAAQLAGAVSAADDAATQAKAAYQKMASTPVLLLSLQALLDSHNIKVDLHDKFGQAVQQVSSQLASILDNALSITLQAGNLLLNTVLMLLISIYFLSDGSRFIRWLVHLTPKESQPEVNHMVNSLNQIMGGYLRTQILLALLAGLADASGALILGIPYAIVIFFSSFFLSLVPVIGPVVLPFPPMIIALVFSPLPRPIFYLFWLLIGEQAVTNVVGPRLQAHNLKIYPLEAMAAALIGLPLAGLPGAFFAVPIVAFGHIVIGELMRSRKVRTPTAPPARPPAT
jgi:predicted PurR-regulated permease PerM